MNVHPVRMDLEYESLHIAVSEMMFGETNELHYENEFNQKLWDNNIYIRGNSLALNNSLLKCK